MNSVFKWKRIMKKLKDYKQFYQACTPKFLEREIFPIQGETAAV